MKDVNIRHVIVHELIKESKQDFDFSKPYNLRKTTLDPENSTVKKLISEVCKLYGTKGNSAHYGIFKNLPDQQDAIPYKFQNYLSPECETESSFIPLSISIMKKFVETAKEETWSSGGFIVFCDYETEGCRFFLVSMIKKKDGVTISPKLEPEDMIHLDLNKINQAARINFQMYHDFHISDEAEQADLNYLSFVSKGSGQSASAYFIAAIGCDKGMASTKATTKLPAEVKKFFLKNKELKNSALRFRQDVVEYMQRQAENNTSARLSDIETLAISHMTYVEEERREELIQEMMSHLNSENVRIPVEFVISKPSLKKIVNITYKSVGLSFSFEKELLGYTADADIWYDEKTGRLSFNNLPEEIKSSINLALQEIKKLEI